MKIYRIKIDGLFYVKGIAFGVENEPLLQIIPTWEIEEAAWYEEDKAVKYCEGLNNQKDFKDMGIKFELEFVKEVQND